MKESTEDIEHRIHKKICTSLKKKAIKPLFKHLRKYGVVGLIKNVAIALLLMASLLCPVAFGETTSTTIAPEFKITSPFALNQITIDGRISGSPFSHPIPASPESMQVVDGEWASAISIALSSSSARTRIYVYFLNDEKYLYIAFDFVEGTNGIAQISIMKDDGRILQFISDGYQFHYAIYNKTGEPIPYKEPPTEPLLAKAGISTSPYSDKEHLIFEMAIPLANNEPWGIGSIGSTIRIRLNSAPELASWPYFGSKVEWGSLTTSNKPEMPPPSKPPIQISKGFENIMPFIAIILIAIAIGAVRLALKPKKSKNR
jgi:hypothetical protein